MESLLSNCTSGGCGAKIGPGELSALLRKLPVFSDENLIVGFDSADDAAVYQLNNEISVVSTVDFFSPMVDDPYLFGKIAAANALSDIYAMGGWPITALNIAAFPQALDIAILGEILRGGAEKVMEASAVLAGGHSIYDKEPKYGLSVTGIVKNDAIIRNNTPSVGDKLILTKPLGVGIVMAANRVSLASESAVAMALSSMERLNRYAAEKMEYFTVSACTDITGFGLLAHAFEMTDEKVSIQIHPDQVPVIDEAITYAGDYLTTAMGQRNRNHMEGKCQLENLDPAMQELFFDPQTSGGLLIAVRPNQAQRLLDKIKKDDPCAAIMGEVIAREEYAVLV